jgi:RNA polymerase sigma factor (sigma-70 family)
MSRYSNESLKQEPLNIETISEAEELRLIELAKSENEEISKRANGELMLLSLPLIESVSRSVLKTGNKDRLDDFVQDQLADWSRLINKHDSELGRFAWHLKFFVQHNWKEQKRSLAKNQELPTLESPDAHGRVPKDLLPNAGPLVEDLIHENTKPQIIEILSEIIAELPDNQRQILEFRFFYDEPPTLETIGEVLECTASNVSILQKKALRNIATNEQFAKILKELEGDEDYEAMISTNLGKSILESIESDDDLDEDTVLIEETETPTVLPLLLVNEPGSSRPIEPVSYEPDPEMLNKLSRVQTSDDVRLKDRQREFFEAVDSAPMRYQEVHKLIKDYAPKEAPYISTYFFTEKELSWSSLSNKFFMDKEDVQKIIKRGVIKVQKGLEREKRRIPR